MRLKFWFSVFVLFLIGISCAGHAAQVLSMRGHAGDDKTRLVIELDESVAFHVSLLDAPPRLVVVLPTKDVPTTATSGLSHLGVRGVAQTPLGAATRLELELKKPITVTSAFTLPRDGPKPDRLVIDFRASDAATFQKSLARTFGTLSVEGPMVTPTAPAPTVGDPPKILGTLPRSRQDSTSSSLPTPPIKPPRAEQAVSLPPLDEAAPPVLAPSERRYIIAVDAGHGGKDPGAVGVKGVREKTITLAAAKELARQLEDSGRYKVVMTRTTDKFILLPDRVKIARAAKADLFVSLHADMAGNAHSTTGLSIYTLSDQASDEQTEKLAAKENKVDLLAGIDLSGAADKDVANILIDLAMRENMNQSRFFAGKIVKAMDTHNVDLLERPHRYAGFAVLKAPDIPSVLVEMGFLSNPVEARRLQDPKHRENLMHGLKQGIDTYFDYLEKTTQM